LSFEKERRKHILAALFIKKYFPTMKKLIKNVMYDTAKSEKILQVEAIQGTRVLLRGRTGAFFTLEENGTKIVPCTPDVAKEFVLIHKDAIDEGVYRLIMQKYFPAPEKKEIGLPHGCTRVAVGNNPATDTLYYHQAGGLFFLERFGEEFRRITKTEAIEFVEEIQDQLEQSDLSHIIRIYFPTTKTA
jgi:hypothetical protein